jgi:arylsulfatase A-like enzyme
MQKLIFRFAIVLAIFGGGILGATLADDAAPPAKAKPLNILFIISDDLRTECSCYGGLAKTPNIDALAAAGIRFDRAYCQYPLCNPSRSSLLTGRSPLTTGILGNRGFFGDLHPDFVSLPKYFKQHGYVTLRTGKIFHGGIDDNEAWNEGGEPRAGATADNPERQAGGTIPSADPDESAPVDKKPGAAPATRAERSDRFIVLPGDGHNHGDWRCADTAIEYLRKCKNSDQPFFIGCGFVKPHSPPTAPQKFYDMYDLDKIPLPPNFAARPTVPEGFPKASIRSKNADLFIGRDATPEEAKQMIRAYLASTSFVDANVGRVIAELDKLGLRDSTIVIFWGDHGYQLGERGKWSKAGSLFEQGDRVPFIVLDPRAKGNGQPCERVIQCIDLYPTLCELCGLARPEGLEGRSFVPLLNDPKAPWDHPAFTVWSEDGRTLHGVAIRTEKWRYAEFGDSGKNGAMLFDETADPQELKNLADDPNFAPVVAEISPLVRQYAARLAAK